MALAAARGALSESALGSSKARASRNAQAYATRMDDVYNDKAFCRREMRGVEIAERIERRSGFEAQRDWRPELRGDDLETSKSGAQGARGGLRLVYRSRVGEPRTGSL